MLKVIKYVILMGGGLYVLYFVMVMFGWWYSTSSNESLRNSTCAAHEASRISFHYQRKGFDLNKMIDSFQVVHKEYMIEDNLAMDADNGALKDCLCCCIDDGKDVSFSEPPIEIYRINIVHYTHDIVYVDIISTYKNGEWHCSLTSKLDSAEKRRIRDRFNTEILMRLPMIKDTSSHGND